MNWKFSIDICPEARASTAPIFPWWYEITIPNEKDPCPRAFYISHQRIFLLVNPHITHIGTVYPEKYAHGFVVLCFAVVMQSFIMNSHELFIHIHQGCFAGTGAIVKLPQCQWSKPGGYGKISQCITTTKHSKAKTVCIFLGIDCSYLSTMVMSKQGSTFHFIDSLFGQSNGTFPSQDQYIQCGHFIFTKTFDMTGLTYVCIVYENW